MEVSMALTGVPTLEDVSSDILNSDR